jgi:hypothetical protein
MSTLKADTLVAADGTSPVTLTKQQAAKIVYGISQRTDTQIGHAAGATSSQSLNVSSVLDNTTGDATVNATNAMNALDYIFVSGTLSTNNTATLAPDSTTSAVDLRINDADTGSAQDNLHYGVVHGDLA